MKPFLEWLLEKLTVPNAEAGLGRRRHTMPQLSDFDAFSKDMKKQKIGITTSLVDPKTLTPTQSNFNEDKVKKMVAEGAWKTGAIIISKDGYVIDGHHRWLAACEADGQINCRIVDISANDLLDHLEDQEYIEKRGINESVTHEQDS